MRNDLRRSSHPPRTALVLGLVAVLVAACGATGGAVTSASPPTVATGRPPVASPIPSGSARPSMAPAATASPVPAPTVAPTLAPTAVPSAEPFALSLSSREDFVAQYTFEWCVGASLQMALRITDRSADETRATQQELWEMARDRSFSPFGGANPRGWTAALNDLDVGPYELVSLPTYDEALRVAATALRATERPVGLVMWRGRHAWVMSGFEAIGDPAVHDDFELTGIRVLDPLFPHGSSVWGPSPKPNSVVSPEVLGRQFVLRDSTRVNLGVPPGYLLVLPVAG